MTPTGLVLVSCADALEGSRALPDESVDLVFLDPPYGGLVKLPFDRYTGTKEYLADMMPVINVLHSKLKPHGSMLLMGGIGRHGHRPLQDLMRAIEASPQYHYRDWITWRKRRAVGRDDRLLFCREEIIWYSKNPTCWTFNVPYQTTKRQGTGWNKRYPAKDERLRVSNVFHDITEVMHPKYPTQKPTKLLKRLIEMLTNEGDLVADVFCGSGTTGVVCQSLGRDCIMSDRSPEAVDISLRRLRTEFILDS